MVQVIFRLHGIRSKDVYSNCRVLSVQFVRERYSSFIELAVDDGALYDGREMSDEKIQMGFDLLACSEGDDALRI
jgi:hypothetical protein